MSLSRRPTPEYTLFTIIARPEVREDQRRPIRRPAARIIALDDGSVRVRGPLSDAECEQLEQFYFSTGAVVAGWSLWWPREVRDA
jgi:hypothetical protein